MSCCGGAHETCNSHYLFHGASSVSPEQQKEVQQTHTILQNWLEARANEKGQEEAKKAVQGIEVSEKYAFSPAPSQPFRAVLLSITKLYWLATCASLTSSQKKDLSDRLNGIPAFEGNKLFDGKEVEGEGLDNSKRVEGLMRAGALLLPQIATGEVLSMWQELADAAGGLWEF